MDVTALQKSVELFADILLKYFLALAAVGALAMALIELWKKLRDSRTRYHARMVASWIKEADRAVTPTRMKVLTGKGERSASSATAFGELIHLTTGLDKDEADRVAHALRQKGKIAEGMLWLKPKPQNALFALDLDRMMGHVQEAAEVAISNPQKFTNLYLFVTAGADPEDIGQWYGMAQDTPAGKNIDRKRIKQRADTYARLQQIARRKLDAFQLYSGYRWTNWNIFAANLVGVAVLLGSFLCLKKTGGTAVSDMNDGTIYAMSLLGGMLSPIAKDIVVALRKVRQGG